MRRLLLILVVAFHLAGCMSWDYGAEETFDATGSGLFVVCEGNFQYGNSTLSFYTPESGDVTNEVFYRANGMRLGDVAQSMTVFDGQGWIVVNNSHVVFSIDLTTFRETGRIEGLPSPRYIHFVSADKAYITQLWDPRIYIVNPSRHEVTGFIEVPGMDASTASTEQMAQYGQYVYCTCWSYQSRLIKIDTTSDRVVGSLQVGIQPRYVAVDKYGKLWVMTDGGYEGSPAGHEPPALHRVDPTTLTIELTLPMAANAAPHDMVMSSDRSALLWADGPKVWMMDVAASRLPVRPVVEQPSTNFYAVTVSPVDGDIYASDAADYQQPGTVYRYGADGVYKERFKVGVTPGAFCWK